MALAVVRANIACYSVAAVLAVLVGPTLMKAPQWRAGKCGGKVFNSAGVELLRYGDR